MWPHAGSVIGVGIRNSRFALFWSKSSQSRNLAFCCTPKRKSMLTPSGRTSGRTPELGIGVGLSSHPNSTCSIGSVDRAWAFLLPDRADRPSSRRCDFPKSSSVGKLDSPPGGGGPYHFRDSSPTRGAMYEFPNPFLAAEPIAPHEAIEGARLAVSSYGP